MIVTTRPWLHNDFDYYIYNLRTDTGTYGMYADIDLHTADYPIEGTWEDNEFDFYFLDLNKNPHGSGRYYYYEERAELAQDIWDNELDDLEDDEINDINRELDCSLCCEATDSYLLSDEIVWSRNRQEEWYALYRKEYNLGEEHYVDEQDLLDWLGANFTITRTVTQEI